MNYHYIQNHFVFDIPTYISVLLHDFFLSLQKLNIIWQAWNEDINPNNKFEIGYGSMLKQTLINSDSTFLNFDLILMLCPNVNEIFMIIQKIIQKVNYF